MSLFDTLIVQPIFNLLALIYGLLPGGDFGISLILFTILVRFAMWPLVRKQLHQTKLMRKLQPELKKIKTKSKGNRQLESQMMMELYRERGVKPFSSFGLLFLQLPIFIALYRVVQILTLHRDQIQKYAYGAVEQLKPIADIIHSQSHQFDESLFHLVNLTKPALSHTEGIYWPMMVIAIIAAVLQYIQSRQIMPRPEGNKKLRDMFRDSAAGKDVDQAEMSALMTSRMSLLFPLLTFIVVVYLPGALALYYAASSATAIFQQYLLLREDVEEMEVIAEASTAKTKKTSPATKKRAEKATEAVITSPASKAKKKKRRR